jgi:hypothetical protein
MSSFNVICNDYNADKDYRVSGEIKTVGIGYVLLGFVLDMVLTDCQR